MFKNAEKGGEFKEVETIIGPSLKVKGNFSGKGNIVIEGTLDGNLKTSGNVLIGEKARITGGVEAQEVKTGGEVVGNIKAKGYLEVGSSAKIFGDVQCSSISVEKGATMNGKCEMTTPETPIKEETKKEE